MRELNALHKDWLFVRQALSLSLAFGVPVRIAGAGAVLEKNPDCIPVFRDIVRTADSIGAGTMADEGGAILYSPATITPANFVLDTGPLSSAIEVMMFLLPALCLLDFRSVLAVSGVTHSPHAGPTAYFKDGLFHALEKMGFFCSMTLRRFGFHGSGGGLFEARAYPRETAEVKRLFQGPCGLEGARVFISGLTSAAGARFRDALRGLTGLAEESVSVIEVLDADGPGVSAQIHGRSGSMPAVFWRGGIFYNASGDFVYDETEFFEELTRMAEEALRFAESGVFGDRFMRELAVFALLCPDGSFEESESLLKTAGTLREIVHPG